MTAQPAATDTVTVTIDGFEISVPKGTLVIRAAETLGITLRELIELAGGMRAGHRLKFWTPGGSSTPLLTEQHMDIPLDFEGVGGAGSMLGTRALQIFDETTCVLRAALRWTEFYQHESCGKCTPCREGSYWLVRAIDRLEHGQGTDEDLETILDVSDNIVGRAFCALGDAAPVPITSAIRHFRDEIIQHQKEGGCPFDPAASTAWAAQSLTGGRGGSSPRSNGETAV